MEPAELNYRRQVQSQIAQYAEVEEMHDLSSAADYLNNRYLRPRLQMVFGTGSVAEFYARNIAAAVERTGCSVAVSLGAGYGSQEIEIVKWAQANGLPAFKIICLELSPILVDRIRKAASAEGLEDFILGKEADLNQPLTVEGPVAAVMAHHSLHHFVELERIFFEVDKLMHPEGSFLTMDMIGRNGHMRWPETLSVVRSIWQMLPDRLKWDHSFGRLDRWFENWDCSIEGFEGIRSQDILPELLARFRFEKFYANGGVADIFTDRRFGPNFAMDNSVDRAFLEAVQALEDKLISDGCITPVQIFAVMRSLRSTTCPSTPFCYNGLMPDKALRPVALDRVLHRSAVTEGFTLPYDDQSFCPPLQKIPNGELVAFGKNRVGEVLTRWGWHPPDPDYTWSCGIDSALEFQVADTVEAIYLNLIPCQLPEGTSRFLTVRLNGRDLTRIDLSGDPRNDYEIRLDTPLQASKRALLEFVNSRPRQPDIDGGDDTRPLGFALMSLRLVGPQA